MDQGTGAGEAKPATQAAAGDANVGVPNAGAADGDAGMGAAAAASTTVGIDLDMIQEVLTGVAAEDDEVVAELPVYISQQLSDKLFFLQYPLTPGYRGIRKPAAARMKPAHQHLEVDFAVPGGEHLDEDAEGGANIRKMTYASSCVTHKSHSMVGVVEDGALYLTPVKGTLQMRPQFTYLDAHAAKEAAEDERDNGVEERKRGSSKSGPTKLQTQIKRRESRRAVRAREHSYLTKMQALGAEEAVDMKVYAAEDEASQDMYHRLHDAPDVPVPLHTGPDYIDKFAPPEIPVTGGVPGDEAAQLTFQQLATKPVDVQVTEVMKRAHALTFAQLCSCVGRGIPPEDVLQAVKLVARMVLGCWVLNSDLCVSGRAVHVRDYILLRIMDSVEHSVGRLDICEATGSRRDDVTAFLKSFCRLIPERRVWQFKLSPDTEFLAGHAALAASQQAQWEQLAAVNPFFE